MDKTLPHVTHGRPSPRTLEEAIKETRAALKDDPEYMEHWHAEHRLLLKNQISICEALRGMQVIK